MKYLLPILCIILNLYGYAQESSDSSAIKHAESLNKSLSKISVFIDFEQDSLQVEISCHVIENEDAIEIIAYKYQGLRIEFRRPNAYKNMMVMKLDATHTTIDIKTIFSGTYYLDVYDSAGIKCKMFRIEKEF